MESGNGRSPIAASAPPDARIPTEFRYWERVGRPKFQKGRGLLRRVARFDPQPDDDYVRRFAESYYETDPVCERFVADVYDELGPTEGRRMLDQALEHGVDSVEGAPDSMHELFEEFERDPEWLDWDQVELGAKVFRRWGTAIFSFATTSTLEMYSESSIAKPLALSGGYTGERAHKRQMETVRFWIDVTEPGGLRPGMRGRATAMRVRVMHVFVRRRLMKHPEWDLEAWGAPISVSDATLTLMGGSVVPGLALWSIGHQTTIREIEATMHFWRYIGQLLGVQPEWYPLDFKQGVRLMYAAIVKRAYSAGPDGAELVESYLPAYAPKAGSSPLKRLRDEVNYRMQVGYTRFWSAPATYRRHQMPQPWPWALHPLLQLPVIGTLETARRLVPPLGGVADRYQRWRRETWYRNETGGGREAEFKPVEEFRR